MKELLARFSGKKLTLTSLSLVVLVQTYSEIPLDNQAMCWPYLAGAVAVTVAGFAIGQGIADRGK